VSEPVRYTDAKVTAVYTEIEHTADCAIRVQSTDLPGLFLDSARGMYSLTGGRVELSPASREVRLSAPDIETLLVDWLAELAFLLEMNREMAGEIDFPVLQPTNLVAHLQTGPATGVTKLIKAVTYNDLEVQSSTDGYEATIVFDV
jgi:SHS2 domain-containing protein